MLLRQFTLEEEPPAAVTSPPPPPVASPMVAAPNSFDGSADGGGARSVTPPSPVASSPSGSSTRRLTSRESFDRSPSGSGRRLTASGRRLDVGGDRPHSTSHRSSSGRSQFFRANSTPSARMESAPWGHSLASLQAWAGSAKGSTVDDLLKANAQQPPIPEARATFYVVFDPSLHFDVVLEALKCHIDMLPGSEMFYFLIKQLAPKQQNVEDAAQSIGEVLFVTSSWAEKKPFEVASVVEAITAYDLQLNVDSEELRVSLCMPKPEFDKTMAAWQTKHGSSIKTHIAPTLIGNARRFSPDLESHIIVTLGLWFLNLPLLELMKMDKSKAHNQISKQARILQTLTASLVDNNRLQDAEMLCKLMVKRNAFLWPDVHLDVISVNLQTMGDIYMHMGNKPDAIMAYQQSLAIDLQLLKSGHPETNPAVVSEGLKTVASLLLELGRLEEAESKLKAALQIDCDMYAKTKPIVVVESLYLVGAVLEQQRRYADAALYFSDALVVNATVHGAFSSQVVRNLRTLVQLYDQAGRTQEVERCLQRLLAVLNNRGQAMESGPVLDALARISLQLEKYDAATLHASRAIDIDARTHGWVSAEVGKDLSTLARVLFAHAAKLAPEDRARASLIEEAERRGRQAVYVHQKLTEKELKEKALAKRKEDYLKLQLAGAAVDARMIELSNLAYEVASLHAALGQTKEAIEVFSTSMRLLIKAKGVTDLTVLHDQGDLAKFMFEHGDFQSAAELYRDAMTAYIKMHGELHAMVGTSHFNLAVCLEALGFEQRVKQLPVFTQTLGEAETHFACALNIFSLAETSSGKSSSEATVAMRRLYELLWNRGKMEHNMNKLLEACSRYRQVLAAEIEQSSDTLVVSRLNFCRLLLDACLYDEVLEQCRLAKAEMDASLEDSDPLYAVLLNNQADVHSARGEHELAESEIREALKTLGSKYGQDNHQTAMFASQHLVPVLLRRADAMKDETKRVALMDEAEDVAQSGLQVLVKAFGSKPHANVCEALLTTGDVLLAMGNYSAAENVFIEGFEMAKALFGPDVSHPLVARAFDSLQDVWARAEDPLEDEGGEGLDVDSPSTARVARHATSGSRSPVKPAQQQHHAVTTVLDNDRIVLPTRKSAEKPPLLQTRSVAVTSSALPASSPLSSHPPPRALCSGGGCSCLIS